MVDYFDTAQMSSALASLTARVTGKAGEVSLYPVLKKATSSNEQPTPGYIYQVLVEFSFESSENSRHLARYLNMRLQRHSAHGVLKTLKTIKQLVEKGSREFRRSMRQNDEHIKGAPDYGSQQGGYTGTEVLELARNISKDILQLLFDQTSVDLDASLEAEVRPLQSGGLAGMGRSVGVESQGRLEGFGSEPVDKSSVIDRARDMLESVINIPDPKQQIMELCLKDDVGNYEPVHLPGLAPLQRRQAGGRAGEGEEVPRLHTPGRAGGGWEDSSDEETERLQQLTDSLVSEDSVRETTLATSPEYRLVSDFCQEDNKEDIIDRCEETVKDLIDGDAMSGLFCLMEILESGSSSTQMRGLLLLEFLITKGYPSPSAVATIYERVSMKLELSPDAMVAVKAKKIHMILNILKTTKASV